MERDVPPPTDGDTAPQRAMEDTVRLALLMTVMMASGCVVRTGPPPHRRWFWHGRRAEITNPVSTEDQALSLPPKTPDQ